MKFNIRGRSGLSCVLTKESETRWKMRTLDGWCKYGLVENSDALAFVDPSGGPFIALGDKLSLFHRKLPNVTIVKIENEEGIGIVITTEPS